MAEQQGITVKKAENFSEWYTQVIQKADLIDYTDVSGCIVYKPYSWAIWEKVQSFLDGEFKKYGVQNAYFPLFIPENLLQKEANHVEGFAPEVAWVTHGGSSELQERLAVRPTSETIIMNSIKGWIQSHRDLPLQLNQWCSVVRWEFKHPTPFLRGREFVWQEGHTAHANAESAAKEVEDMLDVYDRTFRELLCVPSLKGVKSEKEKFAGADYTLSLETLFPNGKAIQGCTSHFLGQNFGKAFDITFLDENEKKQHVFTNSWGFSTRSLGVMIGVLGDDKGLVLPPSVAPIPVVVVPIVFSKNPEQAAKVSEAAKKLAEKNEWKLDDRDGYSPGYKFNQWEMKGVPIRVELGPKDLEQGAVTIVRRDTGEKIQVGNGDVAKKVDEILCDMQGKLLAKAQENLNNNIVDVNSLDEMKKVIEEGKIARAYWCGSVESEEKIKDATGGKSLNGDRSKKGKCFDSGDDGILFTFGKSY